MHDCLLFVHIKFSTFVTPYKFVQDNMERTARILNAILKFIFLIDNDDHRNVSNQDSLYFI